MHQNKLFINQLGAHNKGGNLWLPPLDIAAIKGIVISRIINREI